MIYDVLFLCTANSARSIMAEALLNHLGRGRFRAYSAGSHLTGRVNPFALATLEQNHLPTESARRSWDEFATSDARTLHFVFTVCDRAAQEMCPLWPGQPMTAHWGVADPAAVEGSDQESNARSIRVSRTVCARHLHEPANRGARRTGAQA